MAFRLDPRLQQDTIELGGSEHALLLLLNDSRYPWFVLVPRQEGASEWFDLPESLQIELHRQSVQLGAAIREHFHCDKINIAALGNIVRQMHLHVVGRRVGDPAWPGPVWGHSAAVPYDPTALEELKSILRKMTELPFTLQ